MRESAASLLSDSAVVAVEVAKEAEERASMVSSRKSSVRDEVGISNIYPRLLIALSVQLSW